MKSIIVYQDDAEKIELFDNTDGDIKSFATKLSNVLKGSTVSIINTTGASLVIRPSKINSILIKDQSETVKITPKVKKKSKEKVDIITDVDK